MRARMARNLSQDQLAHLLGVNQQQVSRLEKQRDVMVSWLVRVARVLHLPIGPLMDGLMGDPMPNNPWQD